MNNHGHIVGAASTSNGWYAPFIYRDGVMREIPLAETNFGTALDINDAGDILVELIVGGRAHGILITPESTIDLNEQTGLGPHLAVKRMNENRVVVGHLIDQEFTYEAVAWSNGVVHRLGILEAGQVSFADDINNVGDVLGIATRFSRPPDPHNYAVLFRNGGISVLGTFFGAAINDLGEVAGVDYDNGFQPCIHREGRLTHLGLLPGDHRGWAVDINNSAQVVGISEGPGEVYRPFLYEDGVMDDLQGLLKPNSGWLLYSVDAINDRGQITGVGYHHGLERPYLLTPKSFKSRRPQ
jgi:probable HAF family extracellular repeat protein